MTHPPVAAEAVIVTYGPDLVRLEHLITMLVKAGLPTTVADNGSADLNQADLDQMAEICDRLGATLRGGTTNRGIPAHLNDVLTTTTTDWILYLDQDSGLTPAALQGLLARAHLRTSQTTSPPGLICPAYRQASTGQLGYSERHLASSLQTPIGSGSLYNRQACLAVGGFSELFPLDLGDFDMALRLQDRGYEVRIESDIEVEHQVGDRLAASGIGQPEVHSPWRYFLKADGTRRLVRRHLRRHPIWVTKLVISRIVEAVRSALSRKEAAVIEEFGRGALGLSSRRVPRGLLVGLRTNP